MAEDYCEMCDLRWSQCVHGMPAPPPEPEPAPRVTKPTAVRKASASAGAVRTSTPRAKRTTPTARAAAPSLVTAQDVFTAYIVRILKLEGPLDTEDMLPELETAMQGVLRARDRQASPTREVRWHATARAERKALIDAGLMVEGKPGVWELTPAGHAAPF